jgi:hypothetical protein
MPRGRNGWQYAGLGGDTSDYNEHLKQLVMQSMPLRTESSTPRQGMTQGSVKTGMAQGFAWVRSRRAWLHNIAQQVGRTSSSLRCSACWVGLEMPRTIYMNTIMQKS